MAHEAALGLANQFVSFYYSKVAASPADLAGLYGEHSSFCHGEGQADTVPVYGNAHIAEALKGLEGRYTNLDLADGSLDVSKSGDHEYHLLVTGFVTLSGAKHPNAFAQTFVLKRSGTDGRSVFIASDTLRVITSSVSKDAATFITAATPIAVHEHTHAHAHHGAGVAAAAPVIVSPSESLIPGNLTTAEASIDALHALQRAAAEAQHAGTSQPVAPVPAAADESVVVVEASPAPAPAPAAEEKPKKGPTPRKERAEGGGERKPREPREPREKKEKAAAVATAAAPAPVPAPAPVAAPAPAPVPKNWADRVKMGGTTPTSASASSTNAAATATNAAATAAPADAAVEVAAPRPGRGPRAGQVHKPAATAAATAAPAAGEAAKPAATATAAAASSSGEFPANTQLFVRLSDAQPDSSKGSSAKNILASFSSASAPFPVTREAVTEAITAAFGAVQHVAGLKLATDGYCHVTMARQEDADKAVAAKGLMINGFAFTVAYGKPSASASGGAGGAASSAAAGGGSRRPASAAAAGGAGAGAGAHSGPVAAPRPGRGPRAGQTAKPAAAAAAGGEGKPASSR